MTITLDLEGFECESKGGGRNLEEQLIVPSSRLNVLQNYATLHVLQLQDALRFFTPAITIVDMLLVNQGQRPKL